MKLATLLLLAVVAHCQNLVTSFETRTLRTDYAGYVGMQFTIGASPLTVNALGRLCVSSNTRIHTVALFKSSGMMVASVSVAMAGCTGGRFVYAPITPTILSAGESYYLATQETPGGDQWWDQGTISLASVATPGTSIYQYNGIWYPSTARSSYGPVDLQYGGLAPTSYIYIGDGSDIQDVPCPASWTGKRLADGTCLAVAAVNNH